MNNINNSQRTNYIYDLSLSKLWVFFKSQDVSYWLACGYLFFEYVRPQTLYPVLNILPYTQILIILNFFILLSHKDGLGVSSLGNKLMIAFLLIIFLSSIFAISPETSFSHIPEFIAWLLIYYIIINTVNTEQRFLFFILIFLLFTFKMAQFSFRNWVGLGFSFGKDGTGGGPGWFENSGEFGVQMCVFFPLALYFVLSLKQYWPKWKASFFILFPIFALSGMVSSTSRGAIIGGGATLLWIFIKSNKKILVLVLLTFVVSSVFFVMPEEQKARFVSAGHDSTSVSRVERWQKGIEMARIYPIFGVGFENWAVADSEIFGGEGGECHNIFIECLAELGMGGLLCFIVMIVTCFRLNLQTRRHALKAGNNFIIKMAHGLDGALVGYLVSGFFVTVLYYPYFWINFSLIVALNNIASNLHRTHI